MFSSVSSLFPSPRDISTEHSRSNLKLDPICVISFSKRCFYCFTSDKLCVDISTNLGAYLIIKISEVWVPFLVSNIMKGR